MKAFRIDLPENTASVTPRVLSQKVLQVMQLLNMYHAELARVLGWQCADIAALSNGRRCLQPASYAWEQALLFIRLYNRLYDRFQGDSVAMYHWMRAHNRMLAGIPHFLIVDNGALQEVYDCLGTENPPEHSTKC
ncbi:MAG TPA: hypothetical protein ENJ11_02450 [Gammaproteobacteria bacterium]|nr:hypothetical protein [Gammaproteobacteria bacterium]